MKRSKKFVDTLHEHVEKPWFPVALFILTVIDNFIFVFPIVPVMVAATLAAPKRWFQIAAWIIVGNTIGATLFSALISIYGIDFINRFAPQLTQSHAWELSRHWVDQYGAWALFINSVLPTVDHPMVAILTIAGESLYLIALTIFLAKTVKYLCIGYLASTMPHFFERLKDAAKKHDR